MGKMSRDKGNRVEREVVNKFRSWGLEAKRVPLSGATDYAKGDIDVYREGRDAPFVGECKARKQFPKWILDYLGDNDFVVLREDHHTDCLFILPERVLRELLCQ